MNNQTKRQHYVPCCYLKFFSANGSWDAGRKTNVYFTDGNISKCVPVNDLAADDYTYSKEFPEFDSVFNVMEKDYPLLIEKILANETLSVKEYYSLILTMIDFNLRNIAYDNHTDKERKDVYEAISRTFNEDMFKEANGNGADLQGMMDWFKDHWRLQPLETQSGEKFITSDNPSTVFSHARTGQPILIYLPVHPDYALVAYDKRHLDLISYQISDDALGLLNGLQVNRCVRQVYADHDTLTENIEDAEKLKTLLKKEKPKRFVSQEGIWHRDFINIASPVFDRLHFIKKKVVVNAVLRDAVRNAIAAA